MIDRTGRGVYTGRMDEKRPPRGRPGSLETRTAQALGWLDPATNAVAPAIHPSTNFARDANYEKLDGRGYSRDENPTYDQVEALLRELEAGVDARVFSSGMAAATIPFLALKPGDHVVAPGMMYFGLRNWLESVGRHWGLEVDLVNTCDLAAVQAAVRPGQTKLVWVETPCNPMWDVTDIAAVADIAHDAGARLGVDSTAASPVLTQPLTLGADLVMHSASKYLNGHGDVIAGALVTARDDEFWRRIHYLRFENGSVLGSFEAWLLLRGLRTLFVRVRRSCESAMTVARFLEQHPKVVEVCYPGLPAHRSHAVASRQMTGGYGGMLSVRTVGGAEGALTVAKNVELFVPATSLGSVESLIEHRASVEGSNSPVPADLLRVSIGLEDAVDLIADLDQALGKI